MDKRTEQSCRFQTIRKYSTAPQLNSNLELFFLFIVGLEVGLYFSFSHFLFCLATRAHTHTLAISSMTSFRLTLRLLLRFGCVSLYLHLHSVSPQSTYYIYLKCLCIKLMYYLLDTVFLSQQLDFRFFSVRLFLHSFFVSIQFSCFTSFSPHSQYAETGGCFSGSHCALQFHYTRHYS